MDGTVTGMTQPRRHTPEQAEQARRVRNTARLSVEHVESFRDDPRRASRNPCNDENCRLHWASPEEAEHIRQTGLRPAS